MIIIFYFWKLNYNFTTHRYKQELYKGWAAGDFMILTPERFAVHIFYLYKCFTFCLHSILHCSVMVVTWKLTKIQCWTPLGSFKFIFLFHFFFFYSCFLLIFYFYQLLFNSLKLFLSKVTVFLIYWWRWYFDSIFYQFNHISSLIPQALCPGYPTVFQGVFDSPFYHQVIMTAILLCLLLFIVYILFTYIYKYIYRYIYLILKFLKIVFICKIRSIAALVRIFLLLPNYRYRNWNFGFIFGHNVSLKND